MAKIWQLVHTIAKLNKTLHTATSTILTVYHVRQPLWAESVLSLYQHSLYGVYYLYWLTGTETPIELQSMLRHILYL